jgi:hypothetical protein
VSIRVSEDPSEGNPRGRSVTETSHSEPAAKGLLSARSAAILGSSFLIAVIAGVLTYLALGRSAAGLAGAILATGTAFAGAVRLLITIIA